LRLLPLAALALAALPARAAAEPIVLPIPLPVESVPRLGALMREGEVKSSSHGPFTPQLKLTTDEGYRVAVVGQGDAVIVEVGRPHGKALTAYVARGTVTPGRIQASFGKLGRIAVRFRSSGRVKESAPLRYCNGESRYRSRLGVFSGDFRFRGEGGFVTVHVHRAKGEVRIPQRIHCHPVHVGHREGWAIHPSENGLGSFEPSFLGAGWRHGVEAASFSALGLGGKVLYLALTEESEGPLAKLRLASVVGPARAFKFNDALTFARVSPPAPFKGSGTYRAAPDGSTTWTGSPFKAELGVSPFGG
jgi:hypothetical protein